MTTPDFWWLLLVIALLVGMFPALWESWRNRNDEDVDWRDEL